MTQANPGRLKAFLCNGCGKREVGGTQAPVKCARCGGSAFTPVELGAMPGAEGVQKFVPGTDTPITNAVICRHCTKLSRFPTVSIPADCPHCQKGSDRVAGSWYTAIGPKAPQPDPEVDGPKVVGRIGGTQPEVVSGPKDPPMGGPAEESAIDPEQYRHEWIADCAREWLLKHAGEDHVRTGLTPEHVWKELEAFYDGGRVRGHLP
jgi:hypothetical protein